MILSIMIIMSLSTILNENWNTIFQAIVLLCVLFMIITSLRNMGINSPWNYWKEREKKDKELKEMIKNINLNTEILKRQHNLILHKLDPHDDTISEEHAKFVSEKTGLNQADVLKVIEIMQKSNKPEEQNNNKFKNTGTPFPPKP